MLKTKRGLPTYSDGVASFYRERRAPSSFGAKENAQNAADLDFVARLMFRQMSVREQDFEFAEQIGFRCSAKLATHRLDAVKVGDRAVVGTRSYQVGHIDKAPTEMFIYLDGGGELVDAR